ncbi:MAG: cation-transporting P-type ATPase [Eubacteriales bacterium]|nr:cation-transporting P-type ATPase [Eubacteriales bacterium]
MKGNFNREGLREVKWETLSGETVLEMLYSRRDGLTPAEISERNDIFGENKLPEAKKDSALKRFFLQFHNAFIYVLIGAAVLTAFMEHWIDTGVILGVVIINAIVGYIQEDKAQKALDSIKNLLSLKASVMREGKKGSVPAETLVPGDIVLLKAGDKIPADMRIIDVSRFEVDESSLTGESVAVSKSISVVKPGTVLGERSSMAYAGTTVRTGSAKGVVTATSVDTEVGKINTMLSETKTTTTPLTRKINKLGKNLSFIILAFSVLLMIYAVFISGASLTDTVIAVIGLAVAAIPEGLPAVITITLAIGVQRMAKRNSIVRRLPSVETLGSVTVICSDKTGTLTKNEMTATNIYTAKGEYDVSGSGYAPEGEIIKEGKNTDIKNDTLLLRLIEISDLCNDAEIAYEKDTWVPHGAPTEAALKALAQKAGYMKEEVLKEDEIPFDSEYKYHATLYTINGKKMILANGAPERLIAICGLQETDEGTNPVNRNKWEEIIEMAAARGQRLIGCAYSEVPDEKSNISHEDMNEKMVFAGIVGIIDPPRPEAIESIRICKNAGIRVKMITGDHVLTASEIGMQMGLTDRKKVISGSELEEMDDDQIREAVSECDIFARTSPEHKLRLVKALQEQDEIVAMTGDGVNDAPALKKADIGVAMGIKGTEVTKDSAEMVLADDNFSSIVSAVEEGRTIYDNIRKALLFILPTNGAEAMVILLAILFGFTMPITPVQILWVNMVTAVTLALALAFEPAEENTMRRPPRPPKEALIGKYFLFRILFVSGIITFFVLTSFSGLLESHENVAYGRTIAVNVLVFCELFYLFNCRKLGETILGRNFFGSRAAFIVSGILVLIQLAFTYLPFMHIWFGSAPLSAVDWLYPLGGGLMILLIVEIEKFFSGKLLNKKIKGKIEKKEDE